MKMAGELVVRLPRFEGGFGQDDVIELAASAQSVKEVLLRLLSVRTVGGQQLFDLRDFPVYFEKLGAEGKTRVLDLDNLRELRDWLGVFSPNFKNEPGVVLCQKLMALHCSLVDRVSEAEPRRSFKLKMTLMKDPYLSAMMEERKNLLMSDSSGDGQFVFELSSHITREMVRAVYDVPPLLGLLEIAGHLGYLVLLLEHNITEAEEKLGQLVRGGEEKQALQVIEEMAVEVFKVKPARRVKVFQTEFSNQAVTVEEDESKRSMAAMNSVLFRTNEAVAMWEAARQRDIEASRSNLEVSVIKPYREMADQFYGLLVTINEGILKPLVDGI